jgi:primosomal protein N' (replication factor Y) (superfamily II helicase)
MSLPNATYDILLPVPIDRHFAYKASTSLSAGQLVTVPFGKRSLTGLVLGTSAGVVPEDKLKTVAACLPLAPLPQSLTAFLLWAAHYVLCPPGLLLKMALTGLQGSPVPEGSPLWRRCKEPTATVRANSKAAKLLALFNAAQSTLDIAALAEAGLTRSDALALVKRGLLISATGSAAPPPAPNPDFAQPQLSPAQRAAADRFQAAFAAPKPLLLQGVTGSGKTEVYCEAIATALRADKQALVLLPEITLTAAMLDRFSARFGAPPVLWHSGLSTKQRRHNWWAIAQGTAKLVIGARSALFLPFPHLGVIVVDEEHEAAYKQEDGVCYHARDLAVARAHHAKIPVILASATPSLESQANAAQGRYSHIRLPERFGGAQLPSIHRIDMRAENLPATRFLSAPLLKALQETLQAGEQSMLFLNRRGYAPLTLCRSCGHRLQCPHCTAWLVQHKQRKLLQCHHCGTQTRLPDICPACRTPDKFAACGPGVERVAEEAATLLPQARIAVMSSDLLDSPQKISDLLAAVTEQRVDILVGTQIMAKGYHFPNMTLVGIVDADLGLSGGDPRASERCYQLLQQVAGRTGRASKAGRAYLQTYQPDHPVMAALTQNDDAAFMTAELRERAAYDLPPYKRLAALTVAGANAAQAAAFATRFAAAIPADPRLRVLGPAPAPIAVLRGQHRVRLLLIADKAFPLQASILAAEAACPAPKTLKLNIDIDPYSFY